MLRVEDLRRERENPRAAFLQFLLNDPKAPSGVHAFVEGQDDLSFYTNFIRTFAANPNDVYPLYTCGDKEGVYKAFKLIMGRTRQGIAIFFVDKDLSDILDENWVQASNIYVTDYYSIENYLVTEDMLFRVWTEIFHFTEQAANFNETICKKFREDLSKFHEYVLPLIAWGIYLRRKGTKVNLKNINFSDFYFFSENINLERSEKAKRLGDFKLLEVTCGTQTPPNCQQEIGSIFHELTTLPPKSYISGKLEIGFFVAFLKALKRQLDQELTANVTKGRVLIRTQIHDHNALEVLGPRVMIPQSLKNFLQKNLVVD
jgi:hypothetical protein